MSEFISTIPATMPIKNDDGQRIGQGVIDMHGLLRVVLDQSEEATAFMQLARLSDQYDLKFSLMLSFNPVEPYVKGQLRT